MFTKGTSNWSATLRQVLRFPIITATSAFSRRSRTALSIASGGSVRYVVQIANRGGRSNSSLDQTRICSPRIKPDLLQMLPQRSYGNARGRPVDAHKHRKQLFRISVVHLNFKDIRAGSGDVVDDWIGEALIIRTNWR